MPTHAPTRPKASPKATPKGRAAAAAVVEKRAPKRDPLPRRAAVTEEGARPKVTAGHLIDLADRLGYSLDGNRARLAGELGIKQSHLSQILVGGAQIIHGTSLHLLAVRLLEDYELL